jgi:hypothetical protein
MTSDKELEGKTKYNNRVETKVLCKQTEIYTENIQESLKNICYFALFKGTVA